MAGGLKAEVIVTKMTMDSHQGVGSHSHEEEVSRKVRFSQSKSQLKEVGPKNHKFSSCLHRIPQEKERKSIYDRK